ncbi:MAG TPA: hypothetical protein VGF79_03525 [Bacteroidia bacterium]
MKKYILTLMVLSMAALNAQQTPVLKSKRGINILPQQGEYCLGFGATPILEYFGNMFNNSSGTNGNLVGFPTSNASVFGKYMKTNNYAYRASIRLGFSTINTTFEVADMSPGAAVGAKVNDVQKTSTNNFGLGFGFEKRKGNTRIQGYYGLEGLISFTGQSTKNSYGNKLEYYDTGVQRQTKLNNGNTFGLQARAFAGVEYFIAPKVSLGAEFGFGPALRMRSFNTYAYEIYNFTTNTIQEFELSGSKSTTFTIDNDNYSGILKLLFYF